MPKVSRLRIRIALLSSQRVHANAHAHVCRERGLNIFDPLFEARMYVDTRRTAKKKCKKETGVRAAFVCGQMIINV